MPEGLEQWSRGTLRSAGWRQWKRGPVQFAELRKRSVATGCGKDLAARAAVSVNGLWRLANSPALAVALPYACFDSPGITTRTVRPQLNPPNRPVRARTPGCVRGKARERLPRSIGGLAQNETGVLEFGVTFREPDGVL